MSSCPEKCPNCDRTFNRSSNLSRHLLKVHKKGVTVVDDVRSICNFCGKTFSYAADLKRHINAIHFYSSNESKFYKCSKCPYVSRYGKTNLTNHMKTHESGRRAQRSVSETGSVKCSSCNRTFLAWRNLKVHLKTCHLMKNRLEKFKKICAICSVPLYEHHLEGVFLHYEKDHGVELKWENHTFNSMVELLDWKKTTEIETTSFYALCGSLKEKSFSYRCHRSGVYKKSGSNKRHIKLQGSCKINAFCPSIIKVRKKESVLTVDYLSTHIGHQNDLKHIPLSLEERILIAKKLTENVTPNEILKNVRESGEICKTPRISLVKKKDINNIKQSLSLGNIAIPPDANLNKSLDTGKNDVDRKIESSVVPHALDTGKNDVESSLTKKIESSVVPHALDTGKNDVESSLTKKIESSVVPHALDMGKNDVDSSLTKKIESSVVPHALDMGKNDVDSSLTKKFESSVVPHALDMGKNYVDSSLTKKIKSSVVRHALDIRKNDVDSFVPHLHFELVCVEDNFEMNTKSKTVDNSENNINSRISILKEKCEKIEMLIHSKITSHSQVDYLEKSLTQILSTMNNWDKEKAVTLKS